MWPECTKSAVAAPTGGQQLIEAVEYATTDERAVKKCNIYR